MRRTGVNAMAALLVALAGLIPLAARARAQAGPPAPNSYALGHSAVVIGPNSPMFDTLFERWFPGVTSVQYFNQLKPLLAIVHNNARRVVKAYVVKWTITNADGSTQTASLPVMWEPPPDDPNIAGMVTVLGPAGTGAGTQLVSPWFHWPKRAFPSLLKVNAVMITFQAANTKPLLSSIQGAASIRTRLDGAIFGDGVFIGPDTLELYERFQAAQEAVVGEAKWALTQLNGSQTDQEIRDQLSEQIYKGRNSTGTDSASLYTAARGEQASRLMSVLDRGGQLALNRAATWRANARLTALRKLGGH